MDGSHEVASPLDTSVNPQIGPAVSTADLERAQGFLTRFGGHEARIDRFQVLLMLASYAKEAHRA